MNPEKVVLDELSSYFNADEANAVPHVLEASLGRIAGESAARMVRAVGRDQRVALVELLNALRNDRSHPLHERIADRTMIEWSETEEEFALFGRLIDAIINDIERAPFS